MDDSTFPLFRLDSSRKPLACGRLHFNATDEVQVRFMAVDENRAWPRLRESHSRGIGGRGSTSRRSKVVLNARDDVTEFYSKHNYAVVGGVETLFGVIRHVRMPKIPSQDKSN
jgi:hypothetical protein